MNTTEENIDDLDEIFEEIAQEMKEGFRDQAAELQAIAISGGDLALIQSQYLIIRARKIIKERRDNILNQQLAAEKKAINKAKREEEKTKAKQEEFNNKFKNPIRDNINEKKR